MPDDALVGWVQSVVFKLVQLVQDDSLVSFVPKLWSSHAEDSPTWT